MAIRKICSVKGEENPWQALADAIIIQAVKDYRNRARMMKRIRGRLKKNKASNFFFSRWFSVLSDLDGYDLLDRLQREAM